MKRFVLVAATLLLGVGAVAAQQELMDQSKALMKANGRNIGGVLSPMARGDKPYDQAAIDAALTQLEDTAKKLPALYPASLKSVKQTTEFAPSPKVWDDRPGFDAAIASFGKAVTDAKGKIKDLESLKTTLPTIGKQCSGCHETFRVKNG